MIPFRVVIMSILKTSRAEALKILEDDTEPCEQKKIFVETRCFLCDLIGYFVVRPIKRAPQAV